MVSLSFMETRQTPTNLVRYEFRSRRNKLMLGYWCISFWEFCSDGPVHEIKNRNPAALPVLNESEKLLGFFCAKNPQTPSIGPR